MHLYFFSLSFSHIILIIYQILFIRAENFFYTAKIATFIKKISSNIDILNIVYWMKISQCPILIWFNRKLKVAAKLRNVLYWIVERRTGHFRVCEASKSVLAETGGLKPRRVASAALITIGVDCEYAR